ncbi:MAG: hypothetical protein LBU73_03860 [Helicobacteraceae bacterium]|nr:hypothetical protein [Helicobacteraceae bacterium]
MRSELFANKTLCSSRDRGNTAAMSSAAGENRATGRSGKFQGFQRRGGEETRTVLRSSLIAAGILSPREV